MFWVCKSLCFKWKPPITAFTLSMPVTLQAYSIILQTPAWEQPVITINSLFSITTIAESSFTKSSLSNSPEKGVSFASKSFCLGISPKKIIVSEI